MPHITWNGDDIIDPYPAVLDMLGETLRFAHRNSGAMSEGEYKILDDIHTASRHVLETRDTSSTPFLDAS